VQHLPNRFYAAIEGHAEASRHDHRKIIDAMHTRNAREARKITEAHILESLDQLIDELRRRGLWNEEQSA
jgi:DNA-binding GntR family transcriptional regulator